MALVLLCRLTVATRVVQIYNPSVFSVSGQRHEIFVSNAPPKTCSDGSGVLTTWSPGMEERNDPWRTYATTCASPLQLTPAYTHAAAVCHPFSGHLGNMPATWAVERWVEHYLERGFDHVYWYIHHRELAIPAIKNVTWFVAPWLQNTTLHNGGQLTAIQHCLALNKQHGTKWALFADVDEYLVATGMYAGAAPNLVGAATHVARVRRNVAGVDFGGYFVSDFMQALRGAENDPVVTRVKINVSDTTRGAPINWMGRRKSLVSPQHILGCNIHTCHPIKGYVIHHYDPREFSLLHIRGFVPFVNPWKRF